MLERSFHFVPAHRERFLARAPEVGADALVLDLEDGVPTQAKPDAIRTADRWLARIKPRGQCYVRVNGPDSVWARAEAGMLAGHPDVGIVLPKAESAEHVRRALHFYFPHGGGSVIVLVEDFAALPHIGAIAGVEGVKALGLGLEDLVAPLRFERRQLEHLVVAVRTRVVLDSLAAGVPAIDTISTDLTGGSELENEALAARTAGFQAKFSIHPAQVPLINRIFTPDADWVARHRRLLDLALCEDGHSGYQMTGGEILSPPKVRHARSVCEFIQSHEASH